MACSKWPPTSAASGTSSAGWAQLSKETGLPVTFAMLQSIAKELPWEEQMAETAKWNAAGANIVAQIALRGNGILMAWRGTVHPFLFKPAWAEIAELPWEEQWAKLSDPAFKARMLAETNVYPESDVQMLLMAVAWASACNTRWAKASITSPRRPRRLPPESRLRQDPPEYAYDLLCANDGTGFIYFPILNYADGNLDFVEGLLQRDDTVISLSDGGAHCGTICDAASPTFLLQHWVRDRARGTITIENAIKRQCSDTARLYGLDDRGQITPGLLADINLIDMARLNSASPGWPSICRPAASGCCRRPMAMSPPSSRGVVTFQDGQMTGALPGRLVRGPQARPSLAMAAE
jgi:N-acyl-D-amino-acid deacylase